MNYTTCYITKDIIQVHVKINPKASVLNMNCYYVTVVDYLKVAPLKIQHERQLQLISRIVHVFAHFRALTVNLQKIHNYILFISIIFFAHNTYLP